MRLDFIQHENHIFFLFALATDILREKLALLSDFNLTRCDRESWQLTGPLAASRGARRISSLSDAIGVALDDQNKMAYLEKMCKQFRSMPARQGKNHTQKISLVRFFFARPSMWLPTPPARLSVRNKFPQTAFFLLLCTSLSQPTHRIGLQVDSP